jgi:hypothetical protein
VKSHSSSAKAYLGRSAAVVLICILFLIAGTFASVQDEFQGVDRIVAVGDVHGGFDELTGILRSAKLLDRRNRWVGGKAHLVQTGDLLDRGPDSRKVMDLLMDLEKQAEKSGGGVHVLLGNHESMNLVGDLRYVSHGEYDAFRTPDSARVRNEAFERMVDPAQTSDSKYRKKWEDEHPLGWVEQRQAFSVAGRYGQWLREKNVVLKINNALFCHGGISPKYQSLSLREINDRVREELRDFTKLKGGIVLDPQGPLWYRGLAEGSESELMAHVDAVLQTYGVRYLVIAHTTTPGVVLPRFGGKVFLIDVGLSKPYGEARACLVFDGPQPYALHRGFRVEFASGDDVLSYLRRLELLEPSGSPLHQYVARIATGRGGASH